MSSLQGKEKHFSPCSGDINLVVTLTMGNPNKALRLFRSRVEHRGVLDGVSRHFNGGVAAWRREFTLCAGEVAPVVVARQCLSGYPGEFSNPARRVGLRDRFSRRFFFLLQRQTCQIMAKIPLGPQSLGFSEHPIQSRINLALSSTSFPQ